MIFSHLSNLFEYASLTYGEWSCGPKALKSQMNNDSILDLDSRSKPSDLIQPLKLKCLVAVFLPLQTEKGHICLLLILFMYAYPWYYCSMRERSHKTGAEILCT